MAYIGKTPEFTQYPSKFFNGDGSAMTVTLDYAPPNDAALLVFIDGVRQDTSAYNCTGTSLTFTGSVPSGTANVQVVHMGLTLDVGVPGDDTVTTVKIQDDAVTAAKLANSINAEIAANTAKTGITSGQATAITANTAKVTNATHTGDVTGATALTIATDAVDIAMLSATGTADATTFLRGDNSWAAAGGGKVLQVVTSLLTTETSYGSVTYEDTFLTGTITPTASDSTILIHVSTIGGNNSTAATDYSKFQMIRTVSSTATTLSGFWIGDRIYYGYITYLFTRLDNPATTSEVTYMIQTKRTGSAGGGNLQYLGINGTNSFICFTEIGA